MFKTVQKSFFLNGALDKKKSCRALALDPENRIWVTDDADIPGEKTYVYRINAATGVVDLKILLEKPDRLSSIKPKYICYSTSKDHHGVWISTFDGLLYFVGDKVKNETSVKPVYDSNSKSQFLGIAHDTENDIIWVTDQRGIQILGFAANDNSVVSAPKYTVEALGNSVPSMLSFDSHRKSILVSHETGAKGKVGTFKVADKKVSVFTEINAEMTYGMAVNEKGNVFIASNRGVHILLTGDLEFKPFTKDKLRAQLICLDNCDYVWVTDGHNEVREYDESGVLVQSYRLETPTGGVPPRAFGLAHCIKTDTLLIADDSLNGQVISLVPFDQIPQGVSRPFKVTANPHEGHVSGSDKAFIPWKILVTDSTNKPVSTNIRLWINDPSQALFGSDASSTVATKANGESDEIKNLVSVSDKGQFQVNCSFRQPGGGGALSHIFSGSIGSFSKITVSDAVTRHAWVNHYFEHNYPHLSVSNDSTTNVYLELQPSGHAYFGDSTRTSAEIAISSAGTAEIPDIVAGNVAGELRVSYRMVGEIVEQGHLSWYINELPDKLHHEKIPDIGSGSVLKQQVRFIVAGKSLPVRGATVKFQMKSSPGTKIAPYFFDRKQPSVPIRDHISLTTNEAGIVSLGGDEDKYSISPGDLEPSEIIKMEVLVPIDHKDASLDEVIFNIII